MCVIFLWEWCFLKSIVVKTQLNIIIIEKNSSSAAAQDRRIDQGIDN